MIEKVEHRIANFENPGLNPRATVLNWLYALPVKMKHVRSPQCLCRLSFASPVSARVVKQLRDFRGLDLGRLDPDLSSRLASVDTTLGVNAMVGQYKHVIFHAPITVRMKTCRR